MVGNIFHIVKDLYVRPSVCLVVGQTGPYRQTDRQTAGSYEVMLWMNDFITKISIKAGNVFLSVPRSVCLSVFFPPQNLYVEMH